MRKPAFCLCNMHIPKTKVQISYMVAAQLIRAFDFNKIDSTMLLFLNLKFQASNPCTAQFVLDLVENPKDRLSGGVAQKQIKP